ncbi:acetolactate synthase [Sulfolobus acidocaldarius SUSAZ]|nr:acetolactate synthase [Sulfolobus acidocaldarius SUSAZ]
MAKSTAEILIDSISSQISDVFGIAGTHGLSLFEEIRKKTEKGELKYFMPRLEYGGAIMADYYARVKENVGVFISVNGPGFTNSLTGLAEAYSEGSPLVLISLNKEFKYRNDKQLHDMGYYDAQLELARQVTKASFRIYSASEAQSTIEKAFRIALEDKMGPVYVEVPVDVLEDSTDTELKNQSKIGRKLIYPTRDELREAVDFINSCSKPILLLGYGASRSNVLKYVEKLGIPVLVTVRGKGAIPEDHPLYAGNIFEMSEVPGDCLIAIGTSFNSLEMWNWTTKLPSKILHVDVDVSVFNNSVKTDLEIKASAEAFLEQISEKVKTRAWTVEKVERQFPAPENPDITHDDLIRVLDSQLGEDRIVIADAGTNQVMAMDMKVYRHNSYFNPLIFNAMGSAIPAGIGAKIASPEREVVSIIGDAGFQACFNELITAVEYKVNFLIVLVQDNVQHFLRMNQMMKHGKPFATDVFPIDYTKVVEGIGVKVFEVKKKDDLKRITEEAINSSYKYPTLLRVHVTPNSVPTILFRRS